MSAKQRKLLWIFLFIGRLIGKIQPTNNCFVSKFLSAGQQEGQPTNEKWKVQVVGPSVRWLVSRSVGQSVKRSTNKEQGHIHNRISFVQVGRCIDAV